MFILIEYPLLLRKKVYLTTVYKGWSKKRNVLKRVVLLYILFSFLVLFLLLCSVSNGFSLSPYISINNCFFLFPYVSMFQLNFELCTSIDPLFFSLLIPGPKQPDLNNRVIQMIQTTFLAWFYNFFGVTPHSIPCASYQGWAEWAVPSDPLTRIHTY